MTTESVTQDTFSIETEAKLNEMVQKLALASTALDYFLQNAGVEVVEVHTDTCLGVVKTLDEVRAGIGKILEG